MSAAFIKEKEYFRLIGMLYLTEDGAFKEMPDNLSSAYIQVEVVYYIVSTTAAGTFRVQSFANKPAMDKNRKPGGPVIFGEDTMFTEAGDGTKTLTLSRDYNPYLTANERGALDPYWDSMLATGGKWYV